MPTTCQKHVSQRCPTAGFAPTSSILAARYYVSYHAATCVRVRRTCLPRDFLRAEGVVRITLQE